MRDEKEKREKKSRTAPGGRTDAMEKKDFLQWNEKMFLKYNNIRLYDHPNPLIRFIERRRVSIITGSVRGPERIVDVGCGEGYVLSRLKSPTIVGVDVSEAAVRQAAHASDAVVIRSYAESLPFCDSYFDAAICSEVLEHTINPKKVLEELVRVVRPGGRIILSIPNEPFINRIKDAVWSLGLFNIIFPNVPRRQDDEWHLHSFDLLELKRHCAGLVKIERVDSVPLPFLPVRYVAICRNSKSFPAKTDTMLRKTLPKRDGYLDAMGGGMPDVKGGKRSVGGR